MRAPGDRFERQAQNEALFRELNERIADQGESPDGTIEVHCECGTEGGCGEQLQIPLAVYDRVRSQDDRFVVVPGHETPDLEYAIDWTDDYVIVDKVAAAEWIVEDDPRGAPSS
jgi:hypothetical protein